MSKLLAVLSALAFSGLGFLYLQTCYAAWLDCPDKIKMSLIPACVEEK